MGRLLVLLCLLLTVTVISSGCIENSSAFKPAYKLFAPDQEKIKAAPTATVADFTESYSENSVKANSDYAGKLVKIRGKITGITAHSNVMEKGEYYTVGLQDDTGKTNKVLVCRFTADKKEEVQKLKSDTIVTIFGTIDDLGSYGGLPTIIDCQVIQ